MAPHAQPPSNTLSVFILVSACSVANVFKDTTQARAMQAYE
jgi:hypothetical protein